MRIDVEDLEHRYSGADEAVARPLTTSFAPGTVTAVTGPSGSGKSTLLYLAALLLTPSRGRIRWGDRDVQGLSDADRSVLRGRHAGFVFQDAMLDPSRTAIENVLEAALIAGVPRDDATPRALELMERFGVAVRAHHRPGQVSGGQAQRIALCRALVKNPSVLFADEPTGNLDSASAQVVWKALAAAAADGATVIVATHDEARARQVGRHVRLGS